MNRIAFGWQTTHIPTRDEVIDEQIRRGYHPAGYGGPWQIQTEVIAFNRDQKCTVGNAVYRTTWKCSGTCD